MNGDCKCFMAPRPVVGFVGDSQCITSVPGSDWKYFITIRIPFEKNKLKSDTLPFTLGIVLTQMMSYQRIGE